MNFFKKNKKKHTILRPFWALFAQIWAKMNFSGKKSFVGFFAIISATMKSVRDSNSRMDIYFNSILHTAKPDR